MHRKCKAQTQIKKFHQLGTSTISFCVKPFLLHFEPLQ